MSRMPVIAVVNRSPDLTARETRLLVKACRLQIARDVAPPWYFEPWPVRLYPSEEATPADSLLIVILEDEKGANSFGYHKESPQGRRYARVFTRPVLDAGGTVRHSPLSIAATLSHEVIEAFVDPDINIWAEGRPGEMWAYEACDPVQDDGYPVRVAGRGGGEVWVSNFVLPTWFDRENPPGTRYDHLGLLARPFHMTRGGYAIFWDGHGAEQIISGPKARKRRPPGPKNHPAARTQRRTGGRVRFR